MQNEAIPAAAVGRSAPLIALLQSVSRGIDIDTSLAVHLDLTTSQVRALRILMDDVPVHTAELARRLELTKGGAITGVLNRLEERGCVVRRSVPGDRRKTVVALQESDLVHRLRRARSDLVVQLDDAVAGHPHLPEAITVLRATNDAVTAWTETLDGGGAGSGEITRPPRWPT